MNNVMTGTPFALAEGCLKIRYKGAYAFASSTLVVSTPAAPVLSLGVSDTDLATAVAAMQTVLTGDATLTLRDLMAAINCWQDTTSTREVFQGDFEAKMDNALETDIFGGVTSPYEADAGTTNNLKNTWRSVLIIDNNVSGTCSLRLPPVSMSSNTVALSSISGYVGTSGTPTVTRAIYKQNGTLLLTTASAVATATGATLLKEWNEPVSLASGPIVIRDTTANVAHLTATTAVAEWCFVNSKNSA